MAQKFRNGGIIAGSTSVTTYVYLQLPSGNPKTGLVYSMSDLIVSYTREREAGVGVTKADQTPAGAWTSGGFAEVSSTNTAGLYRIDWPDTAFAVGTAEHVVLSVCTGTTRPYHELVPLELDPSLWQGTAATGTLTPTQFSTSGLPTLAAGQLNRRMLQFLSGACAGERVLIVGQSSANVLQVAPPLTVAPANTDRFTVL